MTLPPLFVNCRFASVITFWLLDEALTLESAATVNVRPCVASGSFGSFHTPEYAVGLGSEALGAVPTTNAADCTLALPPRLLTARTRTFWLPLCRPLSSAVLPVDTTLLSTVAKLSCEASTT